MAALPVFVIVSEPVKPVPQSLTSLKATVALTDLEGWGVMVTAPRPLKPPPAACRVAVPLAAGAV
jgi:hypothetical protein